MTQSTKTTFWGRNETRLELWEEHRGTGQRFEVRGESVSRLTVGLRLVVELVFNGLWPRGLRHGAKDVGQTIVGKCLALFGSLGQCAFAHSFHELECSEEVWAAKVFSSSFLERKNRSVSWSNLGPAETMKACALIGLHMMAEENALRSDSDSSLEGCVLGELRVAGFPSFTVFRVP